MKHILAPFQKLRHVRHVLVKLPKHHIESVSASTADQVNNNVHFFSGLDTGVDEEELMRWAFGSEAEVSTEEVDWLSTDKP